MACTGYAWATFPHLIGGNRLSWADMERNDVFISAMERRVQEFAALVRAKNAPAFGDWLTVHDADALEALFPKGDGDRVLDAETVEIAERFVMAKATAKVLKDQAKAIEEEAEVWGNAIRAAIGDRERGLMPDGSGFTWKNQHTKGYTVEARDNRILRAFKAPKRRIS
jgi:hypothetical protein